MTIPMGSFSLASAQSEGTTEIYALKTSNLENPIGIEADDISFSWKMDSNIIGQAQKAYQITVNKDAADGAEVWNTGPVSYTHLDVYKRQALCGNGGGRKRWPVHPGHYERRH